MVHELMGGERDSQRTRDLAQPHLARLNMTWEADVEDVYPIPGIMNVFAKEWPNPQKWGYMTTVAKPENLVTVLRSALEPWQSLRSIAVEYDKGTRLIIVLKPTQTYFEQAITVHAPVKGEEDLKNIVIPGNHPMSELPRGLLLRAVVAMVKDTGTVGFVVMINHTVMDAVTINEWAKDIETLIKGASLPRRVSHKAFSEASSLYQTSVVAQIAANFHAQRLRGIGSMGKALWPPSHLLDRAPTEIGALDGDDVVNKAQGGRYTKAEVTRCKHCPHLTKEFKTSVLFTGAITIFNTLMTGANHAIFSTLIAGREWPFVHDSMAQLLPDPMKIAGPTLSTDVVTVTVDDTENISHFLARLKEEQLLLNRHQHKPFDLATRLSDADQAVLRLFAQRQSVNFLPQGTHVNYRAAMKELPLRLILSEGWRINTPRRAFTWEFDLQDPQTLRIRVLFNPDVFTEEQVSRYAEWVLEIVDFLGDRSNWAYEMGAVRTFLANKTEPERVRQAIIKRRSPEPSLQQSISAEYFDIITLSI